MSVIRLLKNWDELRTNYWFVPTVMMVGAICLALAAPELDRQTQTHLTHGWDWTYSGSPEGARAILSTIAGSMITVAGVVFSITIVALSLASAQFGPRLLRNFIRDRSNQLVLGTFTATFIYCLLVLRTVRGTEELHFVPGLSVSLGIVLALLSLGVLIYFIHHVAFSIQASHVIASVTQELHETIDRLWPEELGQGPPKPTEQIEKSDDAEAEGKPIQAAASGYVDAINADELLKIAVDRDVTLRLARRPGHFIVRGNPLAYVSPPDAVDQELNDKINQAFASDSVSGRRICNRSTGRNRSSCSVAGDQRPIYCDELY